MARMRTTTWTTIDPHIAAAEERICADWNRLHGDADPRIWAYIDDVLSGRVLACQKVRLAYERFVRDLMHEEEGDFPWRFDAEKASKPIRFVEKFVRPQGDYDRLTLMAWQCAFYAALFGWVSKKDGTRKHNKCLLIVGSGNGKTPMIAGAALYSVSQEGIKNAEIDVLANSKPQARIFMHDVNAAIGASPALSKKFRALRSCAEYYADGQSDKGRSATPDSVIQAMSNRASLLDGLRPTWGVLDELHEMRTYDAIEQMRRSLDKASDGLLLMMSTMGYVLDGVLVSEYRLADQMLKGSGNAAVNDRELALIYEIDEQDSPEDSSKWVKANPSLGVLLHLDKLKQRWEEGRAIADRRIDFLTKTLNVFTRATNASFLDFSLVERNRDVIGLEAVRGREAFGGFDVAVSGDHCSTALEIPLDDGRFYVIPHTFVPRKVAELNAERLDYYGEAMQGRLTIVEGDYVKQDCIIDWFRKMGEIFDIRCIGYDPANATLLVKTLETMFACEPVRQGAITLNAPMKHIKELFTDGMIVHDQNTLFEWYLNNVKLRNDFSTRDNENYAPKKADKYSKIDAFMAFLDAHTVWLRHCPPLGMESDSRDAVQIYDLDQLLENGGDGMWA